MRCRRETITLSTKAQERQKVNALSFRDIETAEDADKCVDKDEDEDEDEKRAIARRPPNTSKAGHGAQEDDRATKCDNQDRRGAAKRNQSRSTSPKNTE